jgi:hypothetical protein
MSSPTHEEKRQIFQRHFLLGELSPNEIDALISNARVERYPAGREIFAKGVARAMLDGSLARQRQDQLAFRRRERNRFSHLQRRRHLRRNRSARWRGAERGRDRDDRLRTLGFEPLGFFAGPRGSRRPLHDPSQNPLASDTTDDRAGRGRDVPAP